MKNTMVPFIVQIRVVQEKLRLDEDWESMSIFLHFCSFLAGTGTCTAIMLPLFLANGRQPPKMTSKLIQDH